MHTDEPCTLEYTDKDGGTHKLDVPITSLKADVFGLSFYDKSLSMLTTVTWDRVKTFKISGTPSKELVERSAMHQTYYSDRKNPKRNSMNTSL